MLANIPALVQLLSLLTGVLGILVPGLGYLAHERRVLMLNVPREFLEYGPYQSALTGFSVCWHMPWRMAHAATSGLSWMAVLSLGILAVFLFRRVIFRTWRSPAGALAAFLLLEIPAVLVSLGYVQLVTVARNEAPRPPAGGEFTVLDRMQFQAHGWIQNSAPEKRVQADALAGVSGWLMLFTMTLFLESRRRAAVSDGVVRTFFRASGAVALLLSVFFCAGKTRQPTLMRKAVLHIRP